MMMEHHPRRDRLAAHPDVVIDVAGREVTHSPTALPGAPAEVHVLHVHEVLVVKAPKGLKGIPAHSHETAGDPVYLHLFLVAPTGLPIPDSCWVPGAEPVSYTHLTLPTIYSV